MIWLDLGSFVRHDGVEIIGMIIFDQETSNKNTGGRSECRRVYRICQADPLDRKGISTAAGRGASVRNCGSAGNSR